MSLSQEQLERYSHQLKLFYRAKGPFPSITNDEFWELEQYQVRKTEELSEEEIEIKLKEEPLYLYKYLRMEDRNKDHIKTMILNQQLHFPSPNKFNDPFDCKIEMRYNCNKYGWRKWWLAWIRRQCPQKNRRERQAIAAKIMSRPDFKEKAKKAVEGAVDRVGILCLSEICDNILMWAHYGIGHTGFCLEFKRHSKFFGRALKIHYKNEYPIINFVEATDIQAAYTTLLTKAEIWDYEKEWRIVEYEKGPGIYSFSGALLTGIVFGCQMSDENKNQIRTWCECAKLSPKYYQAKKKTLEFGLDIVPLDS